MQVGDGNYDFIGVGKVGNDNLLLGGDGNYDTLGFNIGNNNSVFVGNGNFDTLMSLSGNNSLMVAGTGTGDTIFTPYGTNNVMAVSGAGATIYTASSETSDLVHLGPSSTPTGDIYVLSAGGSDLISTGGPDNYTDMASTTVANFAMTDVIDLTGLTFGSGTTATWDQVNNSPGQAYGTLTVSDPSGVSPTFTGSIAVSGSNTVLTVSSVTPGTLQTGQTILGGGISANTTILGQTSGTPGGDGTYTVSNSQTIGSEAMTVSPPGSPPSVTLTLLGQFSASGFSVASDSGATDTGTDLTYTASTSNPTLGWLAATHQAQAA